MTYMQIAEALTYVDDDCLCLVEQMKKPRRTWRGALKKVAVVILALLIGAGVWLTVDEGARAAFQRWWREVYENSVIYRFTGDAEETLPLYAPTWVPEGYRLAEDYISTNRRTMYYENDSTEDCVSFDYFFMDEGTLIELQDSEGISEPEHFAINGMAAEFYSANENSAENNLIWFDETKRIAFTLYSGLSKDDILRIAESVALETQAQPTLPLYAPTWVPEGFELAEEHLYFNRRILMFSNRDTDELLAFDYFYMDEGAQIELGESENDGEAEHLLVNGMTGDFYQADTLSSISNLIWFDESKKIVFIIDGSLSKADILRVAESVNIEASTNVK